MENSYYIWISMKVLSKSKVIIIQSWTKYSGTRIQVQVLWFKNFGSSTHVQVVNMEWNLEWNVIIALA